MASDANSSSSPASTAPVTAPETAVTASVTEVGARAAPKKKALNVTIILLVMLCCIGWGLAMGILFWMPPGEDRSDRFPETSASSAATTASDERISTPARPVTLRQLHRIDVMLTHGVVAQAMDAYNGLAPDPATPVHDQLRYRISVARELLGQHNSASDLYKQLVGQTTDSCVAIAARLGQARVLFEQGKPQLARSLLASTMSDANEFGASEQVRGEAVHLLALSHVTALPADSASLLRDDRIITVNPLWSATELLELAKPTDKPPSEPRNKDPAGTAIRLVHRYGDHPAEMQVEVRAKHYPVCKLIDDMEDVGKLAIKLSASARQAVADHSLSVHIPPTTVAVALDQIVGCFDLVWAWESNRVVVQTPAECQPKELQQWRQEAAAHLLRYALALYPDHKLAGFSQLAMAQISFEEADYPAAVSAYRQFEENYPGSFEVVAAQFNAGKAQLALDQRDEAIRQFIRVADGGHGHPLQSAANTYVGRLHLENGDFKEATRPLIRAIATAPHSSDRGIPAITLASAYLMAGNAHSATRVLMEERANITAPSHVNLADFISSYARFGLADSELDLLQHGRSLVRSLGNLDYESFFGQHLVLLAGQALQDAGLSSRMERTYEDALERNLPTWVRGEASQRLVAHFVDMENYEEAQSLLEQTLQDSDLSVATSAKLKLAELHLQKRELDHCATICRALLEDDISRNEKSDVLRLLGSVYELQDDHYNAALCFAGMLPGDPQSH